jgi:hypothetical protein
MARQYKLSLLERIVIAPGTCRTAYETNMKVSENTNIKLLRDSCEKGIRTYLGAAEDADDVFIDFTVNRRSEFGVLVPEKNFTVIIIDSGSVTRLPEEFVVTAGEGKGNGND